MTHPHHVSVNGLSIGNDLPLAIIAGPCVMESRTHARKRRKRWPRWRAISTSA